MVYDDIFQCLVEETGPRLPITEGMESAMLAEFEVQEERWLERQIAYFWG